MREVQSAIATGGRCDLLETLMLGRMGQPVDRYKLLLAAQAAGEPRCWADIVAALARAMAAADSSDPSNRPDPSDLR